MEGSEKLTPEIWGEIGKRLETRLDIVRFRSVCKSWRSNLPPPSLFPLRIPPPPGISLSSIFGDPHKTQFFLTEHTGYTIHGCSNPPPPPPPPSTPPFSKGDHYHDHDRDLDLFPIILVLEEVGGNKFCPRPLFSADSLINNRTTLSRDKTLFANRLPVDRLSLSSFFKSYQLRMADAASAISSKLKRRGFRKSRAIDKIVLISYLLTSNSNATTNTTFTTRINPNYYHGEADVAVVALLAGGLLSVLRLPPTSMDYWEWEPITSSPSCTRFDDIVSYNGMVIGVDFDGAAYVMDYKSLEMTQIAPSPIHSDCEGRTFVLENDTLNNDDDDDNDYKTNLMGRKRLVEASGNLYLLVSCRVLDEGDDPKIKVFQLIRQQDRRNKYIWVKVKSLISDNHALFVGSDFSFSTSVARDIFIKTRCNVGNCIFLHGMSFSRNNKDRDYPLFPKMVYGPSIGVYSFEDDNGDQDANAYYTRITCDNFPEVLYSTIPSCLSQESRLRRYLRGRR